MIKEKHHICVKKRRTNKKEENNVGEYKPKPKPPGERAPQIRAIQQLPESEFLVRAESCETRRLQVKRRFQESNRIL